MRFLSIYKTVETTAPPTTDEVQRMQQLIDKSTREGTLIATEGCLPSAAGARVRLSGGKVIVTDGPFVESKELIAGFALLEATSKEHAVELAKEFLAVAGEGECEVRQLFAAEDCAHAAEVQRALAEQFAGN